VVDELKVLQQLGVDRIQGYLTGKPMVLNEALAHQFTLPL
jgi:EAL domain-containing protein (putative c-di-GMP-specific phosphodiesterase class I)